MDEISNEEFYENGFLHEVEGVADLIAQYEDEAYFENDMYVLLVENNCFYFRNIITNERFYVEYGDISRYDSQEYTEDELVEMSRAIAMAEEYGFEV